MKRNSILTAIALAALVVTWNALDRQEGEAAEMKRQEQRRVRSREDIERETREKFGFARHFLSPEEQSRAIQTIKLNLSEYERDTKALQDELEGKDRKLKDPDWRKKVNALNLSRSNSIASIQEQCDRIKGAFQLRTEHMNGIDELKRILEIAKKEEAKETAKHVEELIEKKKELYTTAVRKLGFD